jgi:ribonuclease HII
MPLPPLAELRRRYGSGERPLPADVEAALRAETTMAAQALLAAIERKRRENRSEGQRLRKLLRFERALWEAGVERVAGVDEAGMSPLAGPVVAAAVILPPGARLAGVDDSKKLSPKTRDLLAPQIKDAAIAWSVAFVEHDEIDRINIYWAGILAMRRAVEGLAAAPQHLLLDARKLKECPLPQQAIIHGDARSLSIAAASILAKTARDRRMAELDLRHPGYGFAVHKGYPVRAHREAILRLGLCTVHRRSFPRVLELERAFASGSPPPE